jgi:RNA polymerase sigma factor (sigma-70 family)
MPTKKIRKTAGSPGRGRTPSSSHQHGKPLNPPRSDSRKEDSRLIREALAGNQHAFKQLLQKYHDSIFNLTYRIIHEKAQVEDLTQETFVKAFASLRNFNDEYAFSTWLYKIATNNTIDYIRKRKLETFSIDKPIGMEESDYHYELPDTTYEPDKTIIQRQRARLIEEAINSLPEKYRRVIILRHTEEREYAEIARILRLPIGTVKAHIFRARELLNKYLRDKIAQY